MQRRTHPCRARAGPDSAAVTARKACLGARAGGGLGRGGTTGGSAARQNLSRLDRALASEGRGERTFEHAAAFVGERPRAFLAPPCGDVAEVADGRVNGRDEI